MSKLLIISLSIFDTEINERSCLKNIIYSFQEGKLEIKVSNNVLIVYRRKNIDKSAIIKHTQEYVKSFDEAVVLYHSKRNSDLKELKDGLGYNEKYKNIDRYSSSTNDQLFKTIVKLLESISANSGINDTFDAIWSISVKKNNDNRAYSYRYEIFLPFVFLHFGVQLQHRLQSKEKSAMIFCNKMMQDSDKESDEVNECCARGINILSKNNIELNNKFRELVKSVYTDKVKVTPKIKNDIEEFIRLYGKVLRYAFLELTRDKKKLLSMIDPERLPPYTLLGFTGKIKSIHPLLTDIEKIFNIVDNGVASYYKEVIEPNYNIRHDLEKNAILRLNLFETIQYTDQLKSLKMELKDLKIKFNEFAGQNIEEYFQIDFTEETDEALKAIHEMQEEISTGLDDVRILKMRNNLVDLLENFIQKTLDVAPRDRK